MEDGILIFFNKRISTSIAFCIILFCAIVAGIFMVNHIQQIARQAPLIYLSHIPERMIEGQTSTSSDGIFSTSTSHQLD